MIIDGEKYACEACVRGHRVSNCQHSDRPLQHINKKGRPVSQCSHCRAMRKSRAAHVKCDCGIKPNKCIHLQPRASGHASTCCCNHGGTCTCACSSDGSPSVAGEAACKPAPRARRATTAHSPPRSVLAKHSQQPKSTLRSRSSTTHGRVPPLTITRRRSASSLHGIVASHQDTASGDTTPEHGTENGSPPPGDSTGASMPGDPVGPLELSRSATFPPPYVQNVGYDLANLGGGFSDSEGPLYSAGLATPSDMWGTGELFMPPSYDGIPRSNQMFDFDFGMAPDSYSEQSSDQLPNLAAASSGEVSEVDDHHSPHGLEAVDFLQDQGDYDGMVPRPEIFDDTPVYYTFDDEFQALGYSDGGYTAEKAPEYNCWEPSPDHL